MGDEIPRLRMFAGPNGSGKTTIKQGLGKAPTWFGRYINPDDIEAEIQGLGTLDLAPFGVAFTTDEVRQHFAGSQLLRDEGLDTGAQVVECRDGQIDFRGLTFNSYYASVLADLLRRRLLQERQSFSFETVMSAPDKIELLREAQAAGFRTYLYYVATEDPRSTCSAFRTVSPMADIRFRKRRFVRGMADQSCFCPRRFVMRIGPFSLTPVTSSPGSLLR